MKKTRRSWKTALAALFAAALFMAGCGGKGGTPEGGAPAPSASSPASSAEALTEVKVVLDWTPNTDRKSVV